jgi:hypothetical protein
MLLGIDVQMIALRARAWALPVCEAKSTSGLGIAAGALPDMAPA